MANVLLKPFSDVLKVMKEKYGVGEIPYYVCVGINSKSPVRSITGRSVEYYDKPISEFTKYYEQLTQALGNGYVVRFKWKGQPHTCIFARRMVDNTMHEAHFTDTDTDTWLTIGYDVNDGRFFVYCNYNINVAGSYEYAANYMTDVEVFKIEL